MGLGRERWGTHNGGRRGGGEKEKRDSNATNYLFHKGITRKIKLLKIIEIIFSLGICLIFGDLKRQIREIETSLKFGIGI